MEEGGWGGLLHVWGVKIEMCVVYYQPEKSVVYYQLEKRAVYYQPGQRAQSSGTCSPADRAVAVGIFHQQRCAKRFKKKKKVEQQLNYCLHHKP